MLQAIDVNTIKTIDIQGTEFDIKTLTNREQLELTNNIDIKDGKLSVSSQKIVNVFKLGVKEIRNFLIKDEVKTLKGSDITDDTFDLIPDSALKEITQAIFDFNVLGKKEEKN